MDSSLTGGRRNEGWALEGAPKGKGLRPFRVDGTDLLILVILTGGGKELLGLEVWADSRPNEEVSPFGTGAAAERSRRDGWGLRGTSASFKKFELWVEFVDEVPLDNKPVRRPFMLLKAETASLAAR